MVDNITITIEVPESIVQEAKQEAEHGATSVEDQVIDRLRVRWELDPHEPDSRKGDFN